MARDTLSKLSDEQLHSRLKTSNTLRITTIVIFALIILGWILPGYWRSNTPAFIMTVVVALGISASQMAMASGLRSEISRREKASTNYGKKEVESR